MDELHCGKLKIEITVERKAENVLQVIRSTALKIA